MGKKSKDRTTADSVKEILQAIKEIAKGNYASDTVVAERLSICENCINFTVLPIIKTRHCKVCLCDVDLKTELNRMECPEKKWLAIQ